MKEENAMPVDASMKSDKIGPGQRIYNVPPVVNPSLVFVSKVQPEKMLSRVFTPSRHLSTVEVRANR
jgi:hypothetical protein